MMQILLYAVALGLFIYIILSTIRSKKVTVSDALAALGIIVAIILAIRVGTNSTPYGVPRCQDT